jgi:hypothetical protein
MGRALDYDFTTTPNGLVDVVIADDLPTMEQALRDSALRQR